MKKFYIPQVEENTNQQKEKAEQKISKTYKREPFVSSIYGTKVKDEITFSGAQYGNKGKQYDAFRDKDKRISKDDYHDYIIKKDEENSKRYQRTNNPNYQETQEFHENIIIENENKKEEDHRITDEFDNIEKNTREYDDVFIEIDEDEEDEEDDEEDNYDQYHQYQPAKEVKYLAPPLSLLKKGKSIVSNDNDAVHLQRTQINNTLEEFNISGCVVHYTKGPAVTQFEVQLDPGVKVQKVKNIASNLMANLRARTIRIQAPIPGKSTIGIEVPNAQTELVLFGELLSKQEFINDNNPMNVVLGLELGGSPVYLNIAKMPHCLIGGTTGSGKSVCINSIIASILYKAHPDDVKLILIDPKIIEFSKYEEIPHLATPVITEPKVAAAALKWAVEEMEQRYQLFRTHKVREYEEYSNIAANNINVKHIPYIVIIIDELADLMLVAGNDVEDFIQRLTQKGRASGIHLIVATQRPSVDVIKGTIKTNIPTRIAFLVKTQVDSSIILDHSGAEKLLGNGDMLYNDSVSEERLQGAYISPQEIDAITKFITENSDVKFVFTQEELEEKLSVDINDGINDEYFQIVARYVVENNSASINRIQKTFGIGFNRAQAIMEALEDIGIVSENLGSRARTVEVNMEQLEGILDQI